MASNSNYCLEVRTVQAVAFKVLVDALKDLLTDTSIEFDATGMKVIAMDTSHVVLVHLRLEASKFETYFCEGRMNIGVNMQNLNKIIKTINNNDTLTLFIDTEDRNHLSVKIENDKSSKTTYKLNLLDLDHQDIAVDPTDFPDIVTLPSADFQKICRDMNNLADLMEIKSVQNQLIFSCTGDFCSQETIVCDSESAGGATKPEDPEDPEDPDPPATVDLTAASAKTKTDEIVQGVFTIKHLVLFTKCTNLCSAVELYLKNDYPLIIKYDVASLGSIKLALAPQN